MQTRYLSLAQAANLCPNRPSANAVWRWCRKGVKSRSGGRIYLRHYRVGGTIHTTEHDLDTFFEDIAQADRSYFEDTPITEVVVSPSEVARTKRVESAERLLSEAGI